ncbi:MAG: DNA repair protein RecO [Candidatus Caldatribacteriaceae bacterium]
MKSVGRYTCDEGVVIRRMVFREMDVIVTLFTRRRGKFQAIAKGARKLGNRFGASLDLFNFSNFFFYTASGMANLIQAKIQQSFRNLLWDKGKWASGEYVLYLVDRAFEFEKPEEIVLEELLSIWEKMLSLPEADDRCYLLTLRFRAVLTHFLGVVPRLTGCVSCGKKFGQEESFLVVSQGGRICQNCRGKVREVFPLSPFLGMALENIFSASAEEILRLRLTAEQFKDLDEIISFYLSHHLEKKVSPLEYFLQVMEARS